VHGIECVAATRHDAGSCSGDEGELPSILNSTFPNPRSTLPPDTRRRAESTLREFFFSDFWLGQV